MVFQCFSIWPPTDWVCCPIQLLGYKLVETWEILKKIKGTNFNPCFTTNSINAPLPWSNSFSRMQIHFNSIRPPTVAMTKVWPLVAPFFSGKQQKLRGEILVPQIGGIYPGCQSRAHHVSSHQDCYIFNRNSQSQWAKMTFKVCKFQLLNFIFPTTPLKTNMSPEPENQWLEDVFPTKIVPFFGTC